MSGSYVVHNAVDIVGHDLWLVIDRVLGTAIMMRNNKEEAMTDTAVATAFYERWPSGLTTDGFVSVESLGEDGHLISRMRPLMAPGFWSDHDFGKDGGPT
ncbi:hypothetical protein MSTE_04504 [Mycobacteroides stephanolepidis]|uniref:Uncharacterized protein n=1 Tax=[Mycobacterium] stephanolepidis TaxID=1520670 RepID=A0A1Z4F3L2_9MYCO|nr:hypothetical protein [[Mycobacterium] stephanolepidis]BAX99798.1 hypothetical protein MSTE_04504 [[Mycobacterium] stephanolepidis]